MHLKILLAISHFLLSAAVLIVVSGCGKEEATNQSKAKIKNVLLISMDTTRSDYIGCYSSEFKAITPNIDALAREGVCFEKVTSPVPMTLPAHSSMMTGTNPVHHGIHANLDYFLSKSNVTLAEILKENKFQTGAAVSSVVLKSRFGLSQGFESYDDQVDQNSERRGDHTVAQAIEWIDDHHKQPFFFFLHLFDPHDVYAPPPPYDKKFPSSPYAGEIAFTDACIGKVINRLKALNIYESTLIIVTADHGEMLGEHGEQTHSYFIYQAVVNVPMVMKVPGMTKPIRVKERVGLIDIVPTVCSLLGFETPKQVGGIDLSEHFLGGKSLDAKRPYYVECLTATGYGANSLLAVISGKHKYIQTTRPELYDLADDPEEKNNLAQRDVRRSRVMQAMLREILETQARQGEAGDSAMAVDETTRNQLESLGYVSGGGDLVEDFSFDQTKEDPKDFFPLHLQLDKALTLTKASQLSEAKAIYTEILAERPACTKAMVRLAKIVKTEGDFIQARKYLEKVLSSEPDNEVVLNYMAQTLSALEEYHEALEYMKMAVQLRPDNAIYINNLGKILAETGDKKAASEAFARALEIEKDLSDIFINLGEMKEKEGLIEEALVEYKKAAELDPYNATTCNSIALLYMQQEKYALTIKYFTRSVSIDNRQSGAYDNLGVAYVLQGDKTNAILNFKMAIEVNGKNVHAIKNLALLYFKDKDYANSVDYYQMMYSLSARKKSLSVMNQLAICYMHLNKYSECKRFIQESLSIDASQSIVYKTKGDLAYKNTEYDEAVQAYGQALELNAKLPYVLKRMADVHMLKGHLAQAVKYWELALMEQPEWIEVLNNVAWLRAAHPEAPYYDPQKALNYSLKANELSPDNLNLLDALGIAYSANGDFIKAIEVATQSKKMAAKKNNNDKVFLFEGRLKLYQANKPYIEKEGI